jgi:hypothetical protein
MFNPVPELPLSSTSVRRRVPTVVAVVTQFVTQAGGAHGSGGVDHCLAEACASTRRTFPHETLTSG